MGSFSVPAVLGRPFDSPIVTFIKLAVRPDSEDNPGIQVLESAGGLMGLVGADREAWIEVFVWIAGTRKALVGGLSGTGASKSAMLSSNPIDWTAKFNSS
jgi:hypothetical protein